MVSLSTLLHGVIGFDRYFFIVHPLKYQVHVNSRRLAVCCGVFLLFALSLPVAILLSGNQHQFVLPAMTCAPPTIWPVLYIILIFLPSISLASVSYQRIWRLCSLAVLQNLKTEEHRGFFRPRTISAEVKDKDVSATSQDNPPPPNQPVFTESKTIQQRSSTIIHENTTIFTTTTSDFKQMSEPTPKNDSGLEELKRPSRISHPTTIYVKEKKEQNIKNVRKVSERIQEITTIQTGMPMSIYGLGLPTDKHKDPVLSNTDPPDCHTPSMNKREISTPVVKVQSPSTEVLHVKKANENILHEALDQVYLATKPASAHRLSPSPNRNDKIMKRLNILQWTAVYNPVITWMLTNEASCDSSSVGGVDSVNSSTGSVRRQSIVGRDKCSSCKPISRLRRMHRVSVLIILPVLGVTMSFLPYLSSLLLWEHGSKTVRDFWVVRIICHITFAIMPSATSLLLCVTNKPYRCVIRQRLCCCKQTRLHSPR